MFKHFAMKNAPIGFWVLVIWGGFIQDSAAQNPSLTEESFSQLSIQEREFFLECKEKAESLAITYANIEAKFKVSEVVHKNDSAPSESKFDVTVFNCGGKFRADEMKTRAPPVATSGSARQSRTCQKEYRPGRDSDQRPQPEAHVA